MTLECLTICNGNEIIPYTSIPTNFLNVILGGVDINLFKILKAY